MSVSAGFCGRGILGLLAAGPANAAAANLGSCPAARSDRLSHMSTEAERARQREDKRRWRAANPDLHRQRSLAYYAANREHRMAVMREYGRRQRAADRSAVFSHYGQVCACPSCGATERLTIDHIDGNGNQHRIEVFGHPQAGSGDKMYRWLVKNGFPSGYQTLCVRCNRSKGDGPACRLDHG